MAGELQGKFAGLILDMDGVLYRGNDALDGAHELFPALERSGTAFVLLTNNATLTQESFAAKLARMGIAVNPSSILTSAGATAMYLQANFPGGGGVLVLGEAGLVATIEAIPNFFISERDPAFVVVGLFFGFSYDWLQRACAAIRSGAHFVATNVDATLPVEGGEFWPGAGSIVASVQTGSGTAPVIIGKPSIYGGRVALSKMGLSAGEVLCVGDRLDTDIQMGINAGIPTALLLTGVSSREDVETTGIKPDYIFGDLRELMSALGLQ